MKIDFAGRAWLLELDEVTVKQGEKIAAYTGGLTPLGWYKSLVEPEAPGWLKSMECLYWLMCQQNDVPGGIGAADFAPLKLLAAFDTAARQEAATAAAEAEADPTKSAGASGGQEPTPPAAGSLSS